MATDNKLGTPHATTVETDGVVESGHNSDPHRVIRKEISTAVEDAGLREERLTDRGNRSLLIDKVADRDAMREKTARFRAALADGEDELDDLMVA